METIKKFFPYSFKEKKDLNALIVNVLIQFVIGAVAGFLIAVLAKIPILGFIIGLCGGIVDLYVVVGIVLSILDYMKVLK